MTNEEFDALLKFRMDLEKDLEVAREAYREAYITQSNAWQQEKEIVQALEEVEAQIAAALAEEEADEAE